MDLSGMLRSAIKPKELPEIYQQIKEIWKEFAESPNLDPHDWCEAEGMNGLFPLDEEQLIELFKLLPFSTKEILTMNKVEQTRYLTILLTGIRLGFALSLKRC